MRTLWLDTSCARSAREISELADVARRKGVRLLIHPVVYLERRRQMRAAQKERFSAPRFDDFLLSERINVPPLDQLAAACCADVLSGWFPGEGDWRQAKLSSLGGELKAAFQSLPSRIPATSDWLIAGAVAAEKDARVITADQGEEWSRLRGEGRCFNMLGALAWLNSLSDDPESPANGSSEE